ncbi:histidine kinase [Microbacterium sp.]|uniref:histidine kinase n=1 Tax=Microbacterium sp. TaxID=51671 RepID=UPI0039E6BB63
MPTSVPGPAAQRWAAAILAVEALALFVVAGWEVVALAGGDTDDAVSSLALIVLTTIGAVALAAFAVAVARGQSWGRSGGVVAQLLLLAVAFGAATGPTPSPATALLLAVPAIAGLVVLVVVTRRAAQRRE